MTVAPELPPATVRPGGMRRVRVVVDRTPAGVVALVEPPRPRASGAPATVPLVVPEPPTEPPTEPPVEPRAATAGTAGSPASGVRAVGVRGVRPVGERVVRPAPAHLRLTRRGRLVTAAATLLIGVLALVGVVSRAGLLGESAPVPASAPARVVVAPGETLWSIAQRVAPDRDPRTVVADIRRLNDLPTADVRAGQVLRLREP